MDDPTTALRTAVSRLAHQWLASGLPSRQELDQADSQLKDLRARLAVRGLWQVPPCMVTATLDDGLGQGLAVIERFAGAIGMRLVALGLMQPPGNIVDACRRHNADYLGLTVLQFDSEDDLRWIANHLPSQTHIVAGGPVFKGDPDFAGRTGTYYAARNVADFLRFMVDEAS